MIMTVALLIIFINVFLICHASVDLHQFYPFGELQGDTVLPRGPSVASGQLNLSSPFYFGSPQLSYWVGNDGYVSFNGPILHTPGASSCDTAYSMVAPFRVPVDTSTFGTVQYRETNDPSILQRACSDVISATGLQSFHAQTSLVVTWTDVTFAGFTGTPTSPPQNSFQAVLVTDRKFSFAVFLYNKITWTQGDFNATTCGGNPANGIGGKCQAQIGYSIAPAQGGQHQFIDGSCADAALSISDRSNVNRPGIWVMKLDNNQQVTLSSIMPRYVDMMGHRSLEVNLPVSFNLTNQIICQFMDRDKGLIIIAGQLTTSYNDATYSNAGVSSEVACPFGFAHSFGDYSYQVLAKGLIDGTFIFNGNLFVLLPEPKLVIDVTNASIVDYFVDVTLSWDTSQFTSSTVNITMFVFDETSRVFSPGTTLLENTKNTGECSLVLQEPVSGVFLTKHLIIAVQSIDGPSSNSIFSAMFIFDLDGYALKHPLIARWLAQVVRSGADASALGDGIVDTHTMTGHQQLTLPHIYSVNETQFTCQFVDNVAGPIVTPAAIGADQQTAICYSPFLYSYGLTKVSLIVATSAGAKESTDFNIDVLPSVPEVSVVQVFADVAEDEDADRLKDMDSGYQLKLCFSWDPTLIPGGYPNLNAYLYAYNDTSQVWGSAMLVNTENIPPTAHNVTLTLNEDAMTEFFDKKVIFGIGYVTSDQNFGIFSKIFYPVK